MLHIEILQDSL